MKNNFIDEYKNTKYFKFLVSHYRKISGQGIEFNLEISSLLNREIDELGTVLKCHLIIESYLDKYLVVAHPTIENWEGLRLTFNQKLEMAVNNKTFLRMHYPAVKSLNTIRNKFSHKNSYCLTEVDYTEIYKVMKIWNDNLGKVTEKNLQLVEDFTIWICGNFNTTINGIEEYSRNHSLSGYLEWLSDMNEIG